MFVHPDPNAEPLADFAPLAANIGSFRPRPCTRWPTSSWRPVTGSSSSRITSTYHLWYLHESTLGDFDHTRFEHHSLGGNWFSYEPRRDDSRRPSLAAGTTPIAHLDERDRVGLGAHLLFPSLMVATSAAFFATYQAAPVAPDRTRIELRSGRAAPIPGR